MCKTWGGPHEVRHCFGANPDPDNHQNDFDPQHCLKGRQITADPVQNTDI